MKLKVVYGRWPATLYTGSKFASPTVTSDGRLRVQLDEDQVGGGGQGGGLSDAQLRAAPVEVTGAFYPATQPVTGTFWQSVQPVSGPLTDGQLRAAAVPVSGAFWPATQPVSGPLTDAQLRAAAVPVSGTFFQATQPVSLASLPKAREDASAMTWASAKTAAPAQSAVQAETGALAAGDYDFDIFLCASDTVAVGKGLVVEHRNAANNATTHNLGGIPAGASLMITLRRYTIATNERIRVIAGTAAGAASSMYVSAIGRRIS